MVGFIIVAAATSGVADADAAGEADMVVDVRCKRR